MLANVTHAIYGTSSQAASFEKDEKVNMVIMIMTTIKIISINANAEE